MWPFRNKKKKPLWFQVIKPAGESYYVIRRMSDQWEYLYHFKKIEYRPTPAQEFSWHCKSHATATKYDDKQEAIEIVKKFNEFDEVVAEWGVSGGW